jgi:signal peptidase I
VGDHLLVDRITLAPAAKWMPLVHYREPRRNDIIVFFKPVPDPDADGRLQYLILVKRLIGVPGDHIHLRNGIVIINGVAQSQPHAQPTTPENHSDFLDFRAARYPDWRH